MQSVAHHLQVEAVKLVPASTVDADSYARSAFNRYYYATFLCVRSALVSIDRKYESSLNHKGVPDLLRGVIQKRIKAIQKKADKLGDQLLVKDCRQANSRNLKFANTLEKAYAIRVVADYTPETAVDFRSSRFSLSGVAVTEAHDWLGEATLWASLLLDVIRQENA
ncbi:hypothetical protein KQ247_13925 [Ruegeria pomeroyi]|jgi:hypothetical protein|nr:hypothetical protein [Ruegeria pomeroyi]NVK97501.1 hypothetical protein [Ruegeria pomeroyi]NVL01515.1 hypothetical protein [Ruegeria pomeroyi]QWV07923.1 hypothetical protein KQ247_13925 [Ruegeria pomeroyi]